MYGLYDRLRKAGIEKPQLVIQVYGNIKVLGIVVYGGTLYTSPNILPK